MPEIYRTLGKIAAELLDDGCLMVYSTYTGHYCARDDRLAENLRGSDPMAALSEMADPPIVEVADDDPRMKKAIAEARRRWPEFVAAFQTRQAGQRFSVKAPLRDGGKTEFIWIEVTGIGKDTIQGKLDNEPAEVKSMKIGDAVRVEVKTLNDWLYLSNGEMIGGFTVKVMQQIMEGQRKGR